MQGPPNWPQQGYPQQPQQGYPQQSPQGYPQPGRHPGPAARPRRKLGVPIFGGFFALITLVAFAAWLLVGEAIWFYNDGDTKAVLEVNDKKVTIAPHAWGKVQLRTGSSYDAKATFDGGRTETWKVNLKHRPDFPTHHAYALAGTGCFALLDVSKLYKNESPPVKVIGAFKKTHVLEQRVERSTVLEPGELPREATFNRSFDVLVWITAASCDAIGDAASNQRFEATFKAPVAKKK